MSIGEVLFSFDGRIDRSTYWQKGVLPYVSLSLVASFVGGILGGILAILAEVSDEWLFILLALVLNLVISVPFIWMGAAIYAKRWHDLDKSGWWSLIFVVLGVVLVVLNFREGSPIVWIPVVIMSWAALIVPGVLEGTDGPNRYGPKPGDVPEEDRAAVQATASASLAQGGAQAMRGSTTMARGRIIFTGSFLNYAIIGFLIAVLMVILAIPTLGISLMYIPYWSVKYFFAHMEIEIPQPVVPPPPQPSVAQPGVSGAPTGSGEGKELSRPATSGGQTPTRSSRRTRSGEDLELPPTGRV